MPSLEKCLFRFFAHFLIGLLGGFGVKLYKFLINFGYEPLIRCTIGEYVLPFSGFPLHFVDGFLCFYSVQNLLILFCKQSGGAALEVLN